MTILEDLKAGRLVVVPRGATDAMRIAGHYAGHCAVRKTGEPDANWTWGMMIAASPDHTTALLSLVEGMERERDEALDLAGRSTRRLAESVEPGFIGAFARRDAALAERDRFRARALAAQAKVEALRETLEPFARAAEDCGVLDDLRDGKVKPADIIWEGAVAAAITYGDVARALTQEQNNG